MMMKMMMMIMMKLTTTTDNSDGDGNYDDGGITMTLTTTTVDAGCDSDNEDDDDDDIWWGGSGDKRSLPSLCTSTKKSEFFLCRTSNCADRLSLLGCDHVAGKRALGDEGVKISGDMLLYFRLCVILLFRKSQLTSLHVFVIS